MTDASNVVSLAGKAALITGSARGLGAEIAATLARAGAAVMTMPAPLSSSNATAPRMSAMLRSGDVASRSTKVS